MGDDHTDYDLDTGFDDDPLLDDPFETSTPETGAESGSKTITVDSEPVAIDSQTTVADLKDLVNAGEGEVATYREADDLIALNDSDYVAEHVPDGGKISFQPAGKDNLFG